MAQNSAKLQGRRFIGIELDAAYSPSPVTGFSPRPHEDVYTNLHKGQIATFLVSAFHSRGKQSYSSLQMGV